MITSEERRSLLIGLNKFFLLELRKILWKHRISAQEFLSYVVRLFVTGDQRLYDILAEAKQARAASESFNILHTDEESLYSLIEHNLVAMKTADKEERGEDDSSKEGS